MARILPGEYYVTHGDEAISTVLGSCIAACIRDPKTGVGGMNHFMLPMWTENNSKVWSELDGAATRFGNFAMERLINDIMKVGARRTDLQVKLFGGGRMYQGTTDIGAQNAKFALDYIRDEGLKLLGSDLGDVCPRRVIYFPYTGRARLLRLESPARAEIEATEKRYMKDMDQDEMTGDIELF